MTRTPGPVALITGVGGQDGVYLARHLLGLGYRVVGTVRPGSSRTHERLVYLDGVEVLERDVLDRPALSADLETYRPGEIYTLAGLTSVGASWRQAETVAETNGLAVLRILEELVAYQARHGA